MSDENTNEETRNSAPSLSHSQSVKRLEEIYARMEELGEADDLTPDEDAEFAELRSEFEQIDEHRKRLERAAELAAVRTAAAGVKTSRKLRVDTGSQASRSDYDKDSILEPDSIEDCRFRNPWDLSEVRTYGRGLEEVAGEYRARALNAIEKMQGASDDVREAATKILERWDDKHGSLAKQALLTSSPAYLRAWSKMAQNPHQAMLSAEEARALDEVRAVTVGTDNQGGYLVPFQLDPTVIITSNGSQNDIRRFARQVVATGDKWHGVSAGAVQWSWDAELEEVSDDSPTFGQPEIDIKKMQGFVPISIEALADAQNITQTVATLLAEGKDELEAVTLISGSGTGNVPTGIVTALDGTAAELSPATAETFALADVYALYGALPARHRRNASWLANNLIYNRVRQFDTAGGAGLWATVGQDQPAQLLGRPVGEAEAMDATWNPAATADNFVAIFGNFQHYVIADRVGTTVEFIPHLFGANRRPNGSRGWYAYTRMGAGITNVNAFKVLNIATTA
ncbi:phage major capsid protein [Mycolicibacterium conceptionense]|uniref:phage major capsid protein n=1 Tax=Mycolicibacterium conceptionense TaxID=451644 RepID=UPI0003029604|nr:phage major capsid protein [Mycolicibacterium conceptionense]OBK09011.1 capsid protein [Mycolicibacterium conceptionense]